MSRSIRSTNAPIVASALALVACAGGPSPGATARALDPTTVVVTRIPTSDTPESPPVETRVSELGSTNSQPSADTDLADLDDSQLAGVVRALLDGEIRAAQLAESHAGTAEVKRFAHDTTTACLDMQSRQSAILVRLPIAPPQESGASELVKNATQSEISFLQGLHGASFDREYADAQIRDQSAALDLVRRVGSKVKDPDYRAHVQDIQSRIEVRLHMAQALQAKLEKAASRP